MAEYLALERQWQESGELNPEALRASREFCGEIERKAPEEIEAFDYFLRHMPESDAELELTVLKGHLLIEQKINEFISERLLTPKALEDARLTSHQRICLAESLCLTNEEPRWLWGMAKRLNKIRNDLAHQLEPKGLESRVLAFVVDYKRAHFVHGDLFGCLGHFYSQLVGLVLVARSADFKTRGK